MSLYVRVCVRSQLFLLYSKYNGAIFQEELAVIHGKVRTLIAANRTDLPHVDVQPIQTREKSPGPMHTPKDLLEMEGC